MWNCLELEVLSFSFSLLLNPAAYHLVVATLQSICVPNEDVVDVSFAGPKVPRVAFIKFRQYGRHNLLSLLMFIIVAYVEDLADAEGVHSFLLADGV